MFGLRRKKHKSDNESSDQDLTRTEQAEGEQKTTKRSWFSRLKQGLNRTRHQLSDGLATVFLGKKTIDDELFEQIEEQLLTADVGVETTMRIMDELTAEVSRQTLKDVGELYEALKDKLAKCLLNVEKPIQVDAKSPFVILVVGVNGNGKTTTIGKLAKYYQQKGHSVMLAAGDTFRAAAVEQLKVWGERNEIPVVAQETGADSASVVFDAMQAAKSRGIDILLADTAGRLHTKQNLMDELKKIKRVLGKLDESAPHETLLVLDAGTGQNALAQAAQFQDSIGLDGLAITKLDGTAKGGMLFAIAEKLHLPIHFIGVGEGIDDLRPFNAREFVDALFELDHAQATQQSE